MDFAEVVVHVVQADRVDMVFDLLAVSIGQARKPGRKSIAFCYRSGKSTAAQIFLLQVAMNSLADVI